MARTVYLPSDARCRQLERVVRQKPGITLAALAAATAMSYRSTAAYVVRLKREDRLVVVLEEPGLKNGCTKFLYPIDAAAPTNKQAD